MSRLIIFLLFTTIACQSNKKIDLQDRVKEFDLKHGEFIKAICDSLIKSVGGSNSYILSIPKNQQNFYFTEVDSLRKIGNRFVPGYSPSNSQVQYLRGIGIENLHYNSRAEIFFAHLYSYVSGDSSITMYLYYGSKKLSPKKNPFFSYGNRTYILAKKN